MKILLLLFLAASVVLAQDGVPWGEEFRVNSKGVDSPAVPDVSALADGGFVVCWDSWNSESTDNGIYVRRYDATGSPVNDGFPADSHAERHQFFSDIGGLAVGGFVMCWASLEQNSSDLDIYAQRYDMDANPMGHKFRVNTPKEGYREGDQEEPSVTGLSDGGFVVCWHSWYHIRDYYEIIYAQRYGADGEKRGSEFRVSNMFLGGQYSPTVSGLLDGGFFICWENSKLGVSGGILGQRYDADGNMKANNFSVHTNVESVALFPTVAGLTNGGYVICWENIDPSDRNIYAKLYAADGSSVTDAFQVNSYKAYDQTSAVVCQLSNGGFVVCWSSEDQDGSGKGIYAQLYDMNAKPVGKEFRVNSLTYGDQDHPALCKLSKDGFVVCWGLEGPHDYGILGKCFPDKPLHHKLHPFKPLQPPNDATVTTKTPTLSWQPASEMTIVYPWELEYTVCYDTLPDFSTLTSKAVGQATAAILPSLKPGKTWFWKVIAKTYFGDILWSDTSAFFVSHTATGIEEASPTPSRFAVLANYPNPFNPSTTITFEIPQDGFVSIKIYDLTGRWVRTLVQEQKAAGLHSVHWDATNASGQNVAAGVYLYQIEFTNARSEMMVQTKKMCLMK